jgi:hypothetical protein
MGHYKPIERRRPAQVTFNLTRVQKSDIETAARAAGQTVAEYVRARLGLRDEKEA